MNKATLNQDLNEATTKLLDLARNTCWNKISSNCEFILSEIKEDSDSNFYEERKLRRSEDKIKTPTSLTKAVDKLKDIYSNLYDINLYVFQSKKDKTIIEIRYFLKSKLDIEYQQKIKEQEPMLHCKIGIPPHHTKQEDKFDVNWELGGIRDKWRMFLWRISIYLFSRNVK